MQGICQICRKESNELWLLNLAQIDSLRAIEGMNIRQSICKDCVATINQVVENLADQTSMEKAFQKAGINMAGEKASAGFKADLQNSFLSDLVKKKQLVQIESIEGIGWRGFIQGFDNFSILFADEQTNKQELVFKHAIKSLKPI